MTRSKGQATKTILSSTDEPAAETINPKYKGGFIKQRKPLYQRGPYRKTKRARLNQGEEASGCSPKDAFYLQSLTKSYKYIIMRRFKPSYNRSRLVSSLQDLIDLYEKQQQTNDYDGTYDENDPIIRELEASTDSAFIDLEQIIEL